MELLLWAERRKLRRSKILWIAGFATVMVALIVFAQGQFTFYESRYIDGAGWFMTAAQSLATFYVLPAVIALLGSYMICREEQEDTLKSLRLIPVDEVKLTLSKMVLALVFSVLIYLLLFAITFLVEAVLHFEALSIGLVLERAEQESKIINFTCRTTAKEKKPSFSRQSSCPNHTYGGFDKIKAAVPYALDKGVTPIH